MGTLKGLIVAQPSLVRDGLQAVFTAIPGLDALEPVDDVHAALEKIDNCRVDLLALDSGLSEEGLSTTLKQIKTRHPNTHCLAIVDDPQKAIAMNFAGADAVLIEGFTAANLAATIKALIENIPNRQNHEDKFGDS